MGKAGTKKTTSLQARLYEELLDERVVFWAAVYGREIASKMQSKIFKGRYDHGVPVEKPVFHPATSTIL